MLKKLLRVCVWFQMTIVVLLVNLTYLHTNQNPILAATPTVSQTTYALSSSPDTGKILGAMVEGGDARALLLTAFIKKYQPNSPFLSYTNELVDAADAYQLDFRLIPAIAMCESNLGVRIPSHDSYNAWGIAVYTGKQSGKMFNDWPHAIDWVAKFIREKFYNRGITDLSEIGAIWAPPSVTTNDSWSKCVSQFMLLIR